MEQVRAVFDLLNSNLGGLFVLSALGYALFKAGEYSKAFRQLPTLVDDVHQLKTDVHQLKTDVSAIKAAVLKH